MHKLLEFYKKYKIYIQTFVLVELKSFTMTLLSATESKLTEKIWITKHIANKTDCFLKRYIEKEST